MPFYFLATGGSRKSTQKCGRWNEGKVLRHAVERIVMPRPAFPPKISFATSLAVRFGASATLFNAFVVMGFQHRYCRVAGKTSAIELQQPCAISPAKIFRAIANPRRFNSPQFTLLI